MKLYIFWKGIQQSVLIIEMIIQNNSKGLERMKVLIISHVKIFLSNNYDSYGSRTIAPSPTLKLTLTLIQTLTLTGEGGQFYSGQLPG